MPLFQSEVLKEMLPQARVKHDFLSLCWSEEGEAQCGLPSPCKAICSLDPAPWLGAPRRRRRRREPRRREVCRVGWEMHLT